MLIYEKKVNNQRKLYGTLGSAPGSTDEDVTGDFDFVGPYKYKAPGGFMDKDGKEIVIKIKGKQIIPPVDDGDDEEEPIIPPEGGGDGEEEEPIIPPEGGGE